MAEVFEIKVIKPQRLRTELFDRAVEKTIDVFAKLIDKDFRGTQSTFKDKFPVIIEKGKFRRVIWVNSAIYSYLNFGTRIRWALMSRDWRSKTKPRRLKPGPGRGSVVIAGRRAMQRRGIPPRPGIKAREFDKAIVKKYSPRFPKEMQRAIDAAGRQAF